MTKEYLEEILTEYGVAFTDSLADRLLKEFEPCDELDFVQPHKKIPVKLDLTLCDTAVLRRAVKEQMIKYGFSAPDMTVTEFVEDLPPVNLQENCGDCISRQYLLDNCVVDKVTMPYVPINRIQEAPPVTPQESKKGHWIFKDADDQACLVYTCDKCGEQITLFDDTLKNPQEGHYNFCPNCGCMMKSEDQE